VTEQNGLAALSTLVERQQLQIAELQHCVGILQDKDEIQRLQYAYGYFLDNRMFREIADLFASQGAWIEIGGRGRYLGKERIHDFLLEVLGGGRWGLLKNEVINHVQQQLFITVNEDRQRAQARARAEVQGNSPPDTPTFLFADGIYENEYIREGSQWKILSIRVTMTYYAALERRSLTFPTAPPSLSFPPDLPSQPLARGLGRQFNEFHFRHPITGAALRTPASDPNAD
jgi:SnoaL-like domain